MELYLLILCVSAGLLFFLFLFCVFTASEPTPPVMQNRIEPPRKVYLSPKEYLERETYIRALEGDRHARDWITKVLYNQQQNNSNKKSGKKTNHNNKKSKQQNSTPKHIIDEATITLMNLGYSKTEALREIKIRTAKKYYSNTDSIVTDVITTR